MGTSISTGADRYSNTDADTHETTDTDPTADTNPDTDTNVDANTLATHSTFRTQQADTSTGEVQSAHVSVLPLPGSADALYGDVRARVRCTNICRNASRSSEDSASNAAHARICRDDQTAARHAHPHIVGRCTSFRGLAC